MFYKITKKQNELLEILGKHTDEEKDMVVEAYHESNCERSYEGMGRRSLTEYLNMQIRCYEMLRKRGFK